MKHPLLSLFLALGVLAGLCAGFSHPRHFHGHSAYGQKRFEDRIADICVRAADRRLEERATTP